MRTFIALLLLVAFGTSCTSIHYVNKSHWTDLNGYRDPPTKKSLKKSNNKVRDRHNHLIKVDRKKEVVIKMKRTSKSPIVLRGEGRKEIERTYRAIDFTKKDFIGFPVTGGKIVVPRSDIDRLGIRKFDAGKTVALVAITTLATLFILGTIVLATCDGCGSGGDDD